MDERKLEVLRAIVTDYAGSTDFVTPGIAYPVPYELIEVGSGNDPYDPRVRRADPDLGSRCCRLWWAHS